MSRALSLKEAIAEHLNKAMGELVFEEGAEAPAAFATQAIDYGITSIEPHRVSPLETVLRVRTKQTGVRYFSVRTAEPIG